MRKYIFAITVVMVLGVAGSSQATLYDRGWGMIYDDVLNVTWLQDSNYAKTSGYDADGLMNYNQAVAWADQLVYGGYSDWRLPTTGTQVSGDNITSSEMGYLFYVDLGNKGLTSSDYGLKNTSFIDPATGESISFLNMQPYVYWSGTERASILDQAWCFRFLNGSQNSKHKHNEFYAMAVRSGDVGATVPVPSTFLMLVPGLAGLFGIRRLRGRGFWI